jgi:hypothetical protein
MIAYDWASLPSDSIVVDVGGGIGSVTMILACHPSTQKLRFVVQDRPEFINRGVEIWNTEASEIDQSGSVTFQGVSTSGEKGHISDI